MKTYKGMQSEIFVPITPPPINIKKAGPHFIEVLLVCALDM